MNKAQADIAYYTLEIVVFVLYCFELIKPHYWTRIELFNFDLSKFGSPSHMDLWLLVTLWWS